MQSAHHYYIAAQQAYKKRQFTQAIVLIEQAIQQDPSIASWVLLANAAIQNKDWSKAIVAFEYLSHMTPEPERQRYQNYLATALNNHGQNVFKNNQIDIAVDYWQRALQANPENTDALFNLGQHFVNIQQWTSAIPLLARLSRLHSSDAEAIYQLCKAYHAVQNLTAINPYVDVLVSYAQKQPEYRVKIADILLDTNQNKALLDTVKSNAHTTEKNIQYAVHLGYSALDHADQNTAQQAFQLAAQMGDNGQSTPAFRGVLGASLGLPIVYSSHAELTACRQQFSQRLDDLLNTWTTTTLQRCDKNLDQLKWSNFMLAYQGQNDRVLQEKYALFLTRALSVFAPAFLQKSSYKNAKPKIGFVSSAFRTCTVGSYFAAWISALVHARYDVYVFQLGPVFDAMTERIATPPAKLIRLSDNIAENATTIREAQLDLLIYPDPMADVRIFPMCGMRLAHVQACAWGHPETTGLSTIDAYMTCGEMEPENAAQHYTENLFKLPGIGTCYTTPPLPPILTREDLGLPKQRIYLVPQSVYKIHPDSDAVFAEIAAQDPQARLLFFAAPKLRATEKLRARLSHALSEVHANPTKQLLFLPQTTRERFLQICQSADVMVDCLHWSGGNTTIDALLCGLPVITCPGELMRGRQSYAMLKHIGCEQQLSVLSAQDLAHRAVTIANTNELRHEISIQIKERVHDTVENKTILEDFTHVVSQLITQPNTG